MHKGGREGAMENREGGKEAGGRRERKRDWEGGSGGKGLGRMNGTNDSKGRSA